jgi:hypothetical protein
MDVPFSICMTHNLTDYTTSYLVMTDRTQARLGDVRRRILSSFTSGGPSDTKDPFMIHCLVLHEIFLDAKNSVILLLKKRLFDQLQRVQKYSAQPSRERERTELESMTIQLHVISQEIDSMTANVEMTTMIVRCMQLAHKRFCALLGAKQLIKDSNTKITDALKYLLESAESQKRWLISYKSRKDIGLNLVSLPFSSTPQDKDSSIAAGLQSCDATRRNN